MRFGAAALERCPQARAVRDAARCAEPSAALHPWVPALPAPAGPAVTYKHPWVLEQALSFTDMWKGGSKTLDLFTAFLKDRLRAP